MPVLRGGALTQVPTAAGLDDLALFGEAGQHAVQVVLLNPHGLRHLGDGDAGTVAHQVKCLVGAGSGAARTPATPAAATGLRATGGSATRGTLRGRCRRRGGGGGAGAAATAPAEARERLVGSLQLTVLIHERLELLQPRLDLLLLFVEEPSHEI